MEITAKISYLKTAPRKVRLICDMLRGKKLNESILMLNFVKKQAAYDMLSILKSALANAKQKDAEVDKMIIKEVYCNEGPSLKRTLMHSRGRATQIKKRMSHVTVILSDNRKSEILNSKSETKSNTKIQKNKKRENDRK